MLAGTDPLVRPPTVGPGRSQNRRRENGFIYEDSLVEVHRVVVGPMDNNVHVVRCKETGEAVLVDAANEHELLLEMCQQLGVRQVIETTVTGITSRPSLPPSATPATPFRCRAADAGMLPSYDLLLEDGAVPKWAGWRLETIAQSGPHAGVGLLLPPRHAAALAAATPSSRAARGTRNWRVRTSTPSSVRSRSGLQPVPSRHDCSPRPRDRYHHREREPASPGVDRPGVVTPG